MHSVKPSDDVIFGRSPHSSTGKPRVAILSDIRLYREALTMSLTRLQVFEMLAGEELSRAGVARVLGQQPDSVILDVGGVESFATARLLRISLPTISVVAFAVTETQHLILSCAEAGIAGYVGRDGSEQDIVDAVECALRGELYCSKRVAGILSRHIAAVSAQSSPLDRHPALTEREHQVLNLIVEGMSNKEIGRALQICDATVKNHVHNILHKLHVHRRGEAAARFRSRDSFSSQVRSWRENISPLTAVSTNGCAPNAPGCRATPRPPRPSTTC